MGQQDASLAQFQQMQEHLEAMQRGQLELQQKDLELRRRAQEAELELRRRAQDAEVELRRLALDRADANEHAANDRLAHADQARIDFANRGQTFAMWLAGGVTVSLLLAGLVCVFLTVGGVVSAGVGLPASGILLAGGLFAGIANLIGRFLPPDKGKLGRP